MIGLACGDSYRFDCPRDCWVEYDTAKERCVSPFEIPLQQDEFMHNDSGSSVLVCDDWIGVWEFYGKLLGFILGGNSTMCFSKTNKVLQDEV
ncbi:hypothetical protein ACI65C_001610 [Semiaphis heraclei]